MYYWYYHLSKSATVIDSNVSYFWQPPPQILIPMHTDMLMSMLYKMECYLFFINHRLSTFNSKVSFYTPSTNNTQTYIINYNCKKFLVRFESCKYEVFTFSFNFIFVLLGHFGFRITKSQRKNIIEFRSGYRNQSANNIMHQI